MNKSESLAELATALSQAQAAIEGASKDKANPHFRSKYADLASVTDAIKPHLAAHGLAYVQISHPVESGVAIETVILHESGEWLSCGTVSIPASKIDAQGYGSALTYARRYSLSAAFGVCPEDDDGNQATKTAPRQDADMAKFQLIQGDIGRASSRAAAHQITSDGLKWASSIKRKDFHDAIASAYESAKKKFLEEA